MAPKIALGGNGEVVPLEGERMVQCKTIGTLLLDCSAGRMNHQSRAQNLTSKSLACDAANLNPANPANPALHIAPGGLPVVLGGTMFRSAQFGFYEAALGTELMPGYRIDVLDHEH